MRLRSSSLQPPGKHVNAIGSSRESNSPHRICHLRPVPLVHVADFLKSLAESTMPGKIFLRVIDSFFANQFLIVRISFDD